METKHSTLYTREAANLDILQNCTIAVIGYGNQGRAQALNLRDSGARVIIGNLQDRYGDLARADGFQMHEISSAVAQAEIVMLLIPDEVLPGVFETNIKPSSVSATNSTPRARTNWSTSTPSGRRKRNPRSAGMAGKPISARNRRSSASAWRIPPKMPRSRVACPLGFLRFASTSGFGCGAGGNFGS